MFLTEFDINVGRRGGRQLLSSRERLHAAVLGCFPPGQASAGEARTLWRLDHLESHAAKLLIVSPLRPDLTALNEQAGWTTGAPGRSADYAPFLERLETGQTWRFRLAANPTRATRLPDKTRSQRLAHVTAGQQLDWLVNRTKKLGFRLPLDANDVPLTRVTRRDVARFRRGGSSEVTIAVAQYDGILEVTDADSLRRALTQGIGPAKGYGCGLLTLAPTRR